MSASTRTPWRRSTKSAVALASAAIVLAGLGLGATSAQAGAAPSVIPQTADLSVWGPPNDPDHPNQNLTTLTQPLGFAIDSAGRQYVTNNTDGYGVKVFASDAVGNVAPIATR